MIFIITIDYFFGFEIVMPFLKFYYA